MKIHRMTSLFRQLSVYIFPMSANCKKKPFVSSACIGCSACASISPEVFTLNDDGFSTVIDLDGYEGFGVDDSITACPVGAISWKEIPAK